MSPAKAPLIGSGTGYRKLPGLKQDVRNLIAEAFLPSFGVIGVGGLVAFVLGSLLLFDTPESTIRVDRGLIAGGDLLAGRDKQ